MKRMHWLVAVTAAVTLFTAGCGGMQQTPAAPDQKSAQPEPAPAVSEGNQPAGMTFEVLQEAALPAELNHWKVLTQPPKSTGSARVGDYLYVLVTGGTDSIGASAIVPKQVTIAESMPPVVTVTAVLSPGKSGTDSTSFPKSYIRIPYSASSPVPGVMIRVEWQGAKGEPGKSTPPIDPNTPVSSPATTTDPKSPETGTSSPQTPPATDGPATLATIPATALPASLSTWRESTVNVPGGVAKFVDGTLYLMVSGGQRNSGGYAVEIKSATMKEGTLYVSALLHSPQPGQMVTQAITYPRAYARLDLPGSGAPGVIVDWK